MNKIPRLIFGLLLMTVLLGTAGLVHAQVPDNVNDVSVELKLSTKDLPTSLKTIVRVILSFVSTVAVIVLIYAGIKYITSLGDEKKAEEAKHAILYAIIGLIVIALSAVIVNLVLQTL